MEQNALLEEKMSLNNFYDDRIQRRAASVVDNF